MARPWTEETDVPKQWIRLFLERLQNTHFEIQLDSSFLFTSKLSPRLVAVGNSRNYSTCKETMFNDIKQTPAAKDINFTVGSALRG